MAGLGATMAQGMAWGVGTSVAREAIGAAMGTYSGGSNNDQPLSIASEQHSLGTIGATNPNPCEMDQKAFMQCLDTNPGNASQCDFYYVALQSCQSSNHKF